MEVGTNNIIIVNIVFLLYNTCNIRVKVEPNFKSYFKNLN